MKNLVKVLGIIAVIAIIGLAVGCSVDPDEQTRITITDIPDSFEGKYAFVVVNKGLTDLEILGSAKVGKVIKSGTADAIPLFEIKNDAYGDAAKVKQGLVFLFISEKENAATKEDLGNLYSGQTDSVVNLGEGTVSLKASIFTPDITKDAAAEKPTANDYGTYTTKYTNSSNAEVTETVVISETSFLISDNTGNRTGTDADHLNFKIENWEKVDSGLPTGYTGGYKFTGRILDQKDYVPSTKTAPEASGFTKTSVAADVKSDGTGTVCWMYIYFKGDTGSITFVRSAFSKTGGTENKSIVTGSDNTNRVYTKTN